MKKEFPDDDGEDSQCTIVQYRALHVEKVPQEVTTALQAAFQIEPTTIESSLSDMERDVPSSSLHKEPQSESIQIAVSKVKLPALRTVQPNHNFKKKST